MQGQVLQALIDRDFVKANRLRSMAQQDFRGLSLLFDRVHAHQQDEFAGNQLGLEIPDALACKGTSHLRAEPPSSNCTYGGGKTGPYQLSPRLNNEPSRKSGAGKDQDR
jgi:hypothetical protein